MNESAADPQRPVDLHRRTWELELLISGAIVVALLNLPAAVDAGYERLASHASRELHELIFTGYYPLKLMIGPAIAIFTIHILARGLWVGLIGLNAVFPQGVQWEHLDLGPTQKRILRERISIERFQGRVDRFASTLFSILFAVLAFSLSFGLWFALGIVAALVLQALGVEMPIGQLVTRTSVGLLLAVVVPGLVSTLLDRILARRNQENGWLATLSRRLYLVSWYALLSFLWLPAYYVLTSNMAKRKLSVWKETLWSLPVALLFVVTVLVPLSAPRFSQRLDSYIWAPHDPAEHGMLSSHYDTLRTGGEQQRVPSIETDVPERPWLRLYLPYSARRDNPRLAEVCPEVEPFRTDGDLIAAVQGRSGTSAERQAALACFGRLWTIELDGAGLGMLELLFANGQDGRSRGLVTYLDLRGLEEGRHDLVVERRTTEDEQADSDFDPEDTRYHIPFWR